MGTILCLVYFILQVTYILNKNLGVYSYWDQPFGTGRKPCEGEGMDLFGKSLSLGLDDCKLQCELTVGCNAISHDSPWNKCHLKKMKRSQICGNLRMCHWDARRFHKWTWHRKDCSPPTPPPSPPPGINPRK